MALAILLPVVYAAKLTRWLPPYGADRRNIFEIAGANTAHLVLDEVSQGQTKSDPVAPDLIAASSTVAQMAEVKFVAPEKPYRILIAGDSFVAVAGGFGDIFEQKMVGFSDVTVRRLGKVSSGLSRPDYFDWNKEATVAIDAFSPNIAVVMMGTNDAQSFEIIKDGKKEIAQYGSGQWDGEYSRRADAFIKLFTDRGIALYWIGLPVMRDPIYAAKIKHVGDLQKQAAGREPMAKFFSGQELMAGDKTDYQAFVADEKGVSRATRNPDGVHLSYFGGTILVDRLVTKLGEDIQLTVPDTPKNAE